MSSGKEDGEEVEYRTRVDEGNPDGGWVEFHYTQERILTERRSSGSGAVLSIPNE